MDNARPICSWERIFHFLFRIESTEREVEGCVRLKFMRDPGREPGERGQHMYKPPAGLIWALYDRPIALPHDPRSKRRDVQQNLGYSEIDLTSWNLFNISFRNLSFTSTGNRLFSAI